MSSTESVAQHIAKVENLAKQIRETGDSISEAAVITKILGTLPSKFRNFRQAWLSISEDKQTIPNLTARLLDEENSLTSIEEVDTALTVSKNSQEKKPFKGNKGITCFNCHKKGHIAKFCRNRKKNKSGNGQENVGNASAFRTLETDTRYELELPSSDKWIMDRGASAYMTFRKELFTTFQEEEKENSYVTLGNNTNLLIQGRGTVKIRKFVNNKWEDGEINNVLYVPELRKNLFSEGVVTNKGMKIVKVNERAQIYGKCGLLAQAVRDANNLYIMQFRTVTSETNIAEENPLRVWHERLAHINVKKIWYRKT